MCIALSLMVQSLSTNQFKRSIMNTLNHIETIALSCSAAPKLVAELKRALPDESQEEFDFTVRIKGSLKKGKSREEPATTSIPWATIAALFMQRCGIQRERALEYAEEAMRMGPGARKELEKLAGVEDYEKRLKATAKAAAPLHHVSGSVDVIAEVTKL